MNITLNKNTVPGETRSPFQASGLRIGTPAVTTRGMKEPEMEQIAELMDTVLHHIDDESVANDVRQRVINLTQRFPIYPEN